MARIPARRQAGGGRSARRRGRGGSARPRACIVCEHAFHFKSLVSWDDLETTSSRPNLFSKNLRIARKECGNPRGTVTLEESHGADLLEHRGVAGDEAAHFHEGLHYLHTDFYGDFASEHR